MKNVSTTLLCCLLILFSCKKENSGKENSSTTQSGEISISFKSEIAPQGKLKLNTEKVKCTIGKATVKAKRDEKRRTYTVGEERFKAKQKANKIKLYGKDGTLLWKIKVTESKMKIGQTEDGDPLYVVKIKEGKHKVMQGEELVAAVKQKEDKSGIKIKNATGETLYKAKTEEFSLSFSILVMTKIPEAQRAMLLSELYLAGY